MFVLKTSVFWLRSHTDFDIPCRLITILFLSVIESIAGFACFVESLKIHAVNKNYGCTAEHRVR